MSPSLNTIRDAVPTDAQEICRIYNPYILHTDITFEEEPVSETTLSDRISQIQQAGFPWLVWQPSATEPIQGYAYAATWKPRSAYRFTVETSIYFDQAWCGQGLGKVLYRALLERLTQQGIHSAIGILTLPNPSSVRLHEALGFQKVGHLPEAGFKFNRWIDVGYWQLKLGEG